MTNLERLREAGRALSLDQPRRMLNGVYLHELINMAADEMEKLYELIGKLSNTPDNSAITKKQIELLIQWVELEVKSKDPDKAFLAEKAKLKLRKAFGIRS
jgi:hypothetical protein